MVNNMDVCAWLKERQEKFSRLSDRIWEFAELPWREFQSVKIQADFLENEGFHVTRNLAGLQTAFMAEWGHGKPNLGFAGEYDALSGLSQKNQATQEPLQEGAPGHGCGHNLLGVGCLAAALALREWLRTTGTPGTVRYYGCPAEEGGSAKAFMARSGVFNDLDAAFNFHPGAVNTPTKGSCVGVNHIRFRFYGTTAHAGAAPHQGRSALDAVELMNIGVNYLREHVTKHVRLHYAITKGGDAPNIVPSEAEVWYYIRAHQSQELDEVTDRVRKIADGAALMTGTRWEEVFESATSALLNNHILADLQFEMMQKIGPILFDAAEMAYAQVINSAFPPENVKDFFNYVKTLKIPEEYKQRVSQLEGQPLIGDNFPAMDEDIIETGSTDVGDLSRVAPLSMLYTVCWATGAPGHSWANVATGAMSIGHKGMLHAAKIMALAAIELCSNADLLEKVRKEFDRATGGQPYRSLIPAHVQPPVFPNPEKTDQNLDGFIL